MDATLIIVSLRLASHRHGAAARGIFRRMQSNWIRWAHAAIAGACIAGASCGSPAPERGGSVPASPPRVRSLTVGDAAPDFALAGSDGKEYRLASYRGKQAVVLAWFAKAFSEG
jgi:AhpC/TSA family